MKQTATILLVILTTMTFAQSWLIDKNGCEVYNPYPRKIKSIEWTGKCVEKYANGYGKLICNHKGKKEEDVYTGFMHNGKPHGQGIYILSSDTKVEGEFKNGIFQKGIKSEKIGRNYYYYKGDFEDNEIIGKGELVIDGLYKYIGNFKAGMENGHGIMYLENGEIFEGTFKDGYYIQGKLIIPDEIIIIGDFEKLHPYFGTIFYSDSSRYKGNIKNYLPHGNGTIYLSDDGIFTCQWKNGTAQGQGEYKLSNNVIYRGSWKKGEIHGKGQIIYPDGKTNIGIWKNGVLIEEKTATNKS